MKIARLALFAAWTVSVPALATAESYVLDRSHAHVTFTVDHLGYSMVHGQFREFDAEIDFDIENVEATNATFVIEAASIDTFWDARDRHIRSKDFLDVDNYPEITFVSTNVTQTGADTADITGDLTIRGTTHEVTFNGRLNKAGPSPFDPSKTIVGLTVEGEIDRTAFGVSYAAPAVGITIPIRIDLEMSPAG